MKGKRTLTMMLALGLLLALLTGLGRAQGPAAPDVAAPQAQMGTAFTYQGKLNDGGSPANGDYDFEFKLYDVDSGGTALATTPVADATVTEGLFTVQLDFGSNAFCGDARWLEIGVRPGSSTGAYTTLIPRQPLTPAPYAQSLRPGATIHNTASSGERSALVLESDNGDGVFVENVAGSGVYIESVNGDGVHVGEADNNGLYVDWAGADGVRVETALDDGVHVHAANYNGVRVESAAQDGVGRPAAGDDGVYVGSAGSPSATHPIADKNGFEVAGAEGAGLYIGQADQDGVYVYSTGADGMYVGSASDYGVNIGTTGLHGVYLHSAGGSGVWVESASGNGMTVASAGSKGVSVWDATGDGVSVTSAGGYGVNVNAAYLDGVYANTTRVSNDYGLYTPDNLYSLNYHLAGAMMLVAQSGDMDNLETGDVVVVSGMGAVFADGEAPVPLVQRAGPGSNIMGVVYSRFVAEEEVPEVEQDGQVEKQTSFHARSAEGPVAPGDYLLVVVLGAAQVKAEALSADILPGDLLAASASGLATNAAPAEIDGLAYYPPGSILGTAMEPLDVSQGSGLIWVLINPH